MSAGSLLIENRTKPISMDEQRKYAYRRLLYWALLDIRSAAWAAKEEQLESDQYDRTIEQFAAIADFLHNLASFSANEFDGFDEEWFWGELSGTETSIEAVMRRHYRDRFEQELNKVE